MGDLAKDINSKFEIEPLMQELKKWQKYAIKTGDDISHVLKSFL
mgnify:CR=1 FL=1